MHKYLTRRWKSHNRWYPPGDSERAAIRRMTKCSVSDPPTGRHTFTNRYARPRSFAESGWAKLHRVCQQARDVGMSEKALRRRYHRRRRHQRRRRRGF